MEKRKKALTEAFQNAQRFFANSAYNDLVRNITHDRLTNMARSEARVSEELLTHIHGSMLRRILANSSSTEEFEEKRYFFSEKVWPLLYKEAKINPGTAQFLLEVGVNSDYIPKFMYNIQHCLAKAVLPASGVGDSLMGDPEVIPMSDPMFPYLYDMSYRMIQYRIMTAQEELKKLKGKKIFCAGGGLLPELWANNYPLGELGQVFIVYDTDETLPAYLEKILGGKLEDFGIDYRCGDCREIRSDISQKGTYGGILANGFMSYSIKQQESGYDVGEFKDYIQIFDWLSEPGAKCCFELQLLHHVLLFDLLVLFWPKGMCTIRNFETAKSLVEPILKSMQFSKMQFSHEPVRSELGETEAGIYVIAEKA